MRFNDHATLAGQHAFLSASNYHWINYSEEKLEERFHTFQAAVRGTRMHAVAHELISLGVKMGRARTTLNLYVNDCIGWRMKNEVVLFYSANAFGTADAISFDIKKKLLRISDLKTGVNPGSVHQLEVYVALFCLEYGFKPADLIIELRIYQNDNVEEFPPDVHAITQIMSKIVASDRRLSQLKEATA